MRTYDAPSRRTVSVTFVWKDGRSKTVAAKVGDTFLDVVLDNNVDIDGFGACEGTLACSTCHLIFSPKDYENLNDPLSEDEQDMLDLACGLTDTCV
ncbi:ferredoxin-1, mitochondrial [Paragonimus westermani]|uniref:Ferredoxin-1, mitochondrial n=1 Tax=Paragonimus westermani TaxID=34504 RepID=A0A5J4N2Z5_9TREM|nr:ferredoxin-1, mitochondrial [Paragonimus westermani]